MENNERPPLTVEVNGVQVFSASWIMEQMSALMRSNDRAKSYGKAGIVLSLVANLICILLLALVLAKG